jgi:hypothetical protein
LRAEAAKPPVRRVTAPIETDSVTGTAVEEVPEVVTQRGSAPEPQPKVRMIALVAGGLALVVVLVLVIFALRSHKPSATNQPPPTARGPVTPIAPPTGTLNVQGNLGDVNVFVDGVLKGFTQSDGKLLLPVDEGTHSVRFTKAGYEDYPAPGIAISANKEAIVPFNLNPNAGAAPPSPTEAYLTIHSAPGGALVSIDKAQDGRTGQSYRPCETRQTHGPDWPRQFSDFQPKRKCEGWRKEVFGRSSDRIAKTDACSIECSGACCNRTNPPAGPDFIVFRGGITDRTGTIHHAEVGHGQCLRCDYR